MRGSIPLALRHLRPLQPESATQSHVRDMTDCSEYRQKRRDDRTPVPVHSSAPPAPGSSAASSSCQRHSGRESPVIVPASNANDRSVTAETPPKRLVSDSASTTAVIRVNER